MMDDRLQQLLLEADGAYAPPKVDPDLAGHVRRRAKRRSARRIAAAGFAVMLVCASAVLYVGQNRRQIATKNQSQPTHSLPSHVSNEAAIPGFDAARVRREYASYQAEARIHLKAAQQWKSAEARREQNTRIARLLVEPEPMDELLEQRDRAAQTLVDYGDSMSKNPWGRSAANAAYRQVKTLFPDSAQAAVARERLSHSKA